MPKSDQGGNQKQLINFVWPSRVKFIFFEHWPCGQLFTVCDHQVKPPSRQLYVENHRTHEVMLGCQRLSGISGMELWNGIVEWNTGMTIYPDFGGAMSYSK